MAENKVNYGLSEVRYSKITIDDQTGKVTYGTPVRIPGAVELTLEPRGEMSEFYADNILYFSTGANQGYDGTLTIANIPQQFAEDCLGEKKDTEHLVSTESVNDQGSNFALMFQFEGDQKARRHVLYNCSASRPTVGSSTKTNTTEPSTNELTFVSMAREDLKVKTKTIDGTPAHIYDAWFRKVYDGIKNTIGNGRDTYAKSGGTAAAGKVFTIATGADSITVTGVKIDGQNLPAGTTQGGNENWQYAAGNKQLTIKQPALQLSHAPGSNVHNIIVETNVGNDILVELTVSQ